MPRLARLTLALALALAACRSEPQIIQLELSVEGMTCNSCVEGIEHEVGRLEGVLRVVVDLDAAKATVVFVEGEIDATKVEAVIDNMGYEATPVARSVASPPSS